jgi:hypothetical protein
MSGRDVEAIAEQIVLRVLGGVVRERDTASQPGVDFVIEARDSSQVAVEVTTLAREESIKFYKASADFGGPADDLGRTWCVRLFRSTTIKKVAVLIHELLRDLERIGVSRADRAGGTDRMVIDRMNRLGVVEVYSVDGPGWILVTDRAAGALSISGDILASIATEVTNDPKRNDAPRLRATGLARRHLFIVVSPQATAYVAAQAALSGGFTPTSPPSAPREFTGVWVGVSEHQRVALWTVEAGWHIFDLNGT